MKRSLFLLSIILIVCSSFTIERDFHSFTMQQGLGDNTIISILKDRKGFMWFGTTNGLSRYDGSEFKNYTSDNQYMQINEIKEVTPQCFALLSNRRLCFFNRLLGKYIPVELPPNYKDIEFRHLYQSKGKYIWAITSKKLLLFQIIENDDNNHSTQSINLQIVRNITFPLQRLENLVQISYSRSEKNLYLLSDRGHLFRYAIGTKHQKPICISTIFENGHQFLSTTSMMISDGFLWVPTIAHGIIRYHFSTGSVDNIKDIPTKKILSHNDVYDILKLGSHQYLAVTWSGYTFITLDTKNLKQYTTEIVENPLSSTQHYLENRMLTGFFDPVLRLLWIGTRGGGVTYVDLRLQYYNVTRQIQHNEICGIVNDSKRYVWLATFHNGIMKSKTPYERGKSLEFVTALPTSDPSKQTFLCANKMNNHDLWFGNQDGTLFIYNDTNNHLSIRKLRLPNHSINTSPVWSIFQDSHSRYWIGTEKALYLMNEKDNSLKMIHGNLSFVRCMAETADGALWVGTENGLFQLGFHPAGKMLIVNGYEKRIDALSDTSVRSMLAASDGNLYVGYAGGLAIINPRSNKTVSFFTTRDGMSSNFVSCIANDDNGHIWIGNASSISRFSRHQHIFYNYYISGNNRSVMFMDRTFFFGNNRNLTYVYPDEMKFYLNKQYQVQFSGLKVANHLIRVGENVNGQTILKKDMSELEKISLSYKNRDFSILFSNLCYSEDLQKYNYRLVPYQKNWLVLNEKGEISYTNLPEGDYVFEVCCIYPDGSTGKVTKLQISIAPPWNHTIWFRLFILLIIIGGIYYLIRYLNLRRRRLIHEMQMRNEMMKLDMDWKQERQIRKERENFFAGVAHELRTPLTLILSPLMELIHQTNQPEETHRQLLRMYKNGTAIQSLVNQLLYVQKIEAGMVRLQLSEINIVGIAESVVDSFQPLAKSQHDILQFASSHPSIMLWIDVEKITSAMRNLLSNAFKYTPSGGTVTLHIDEKAIDERQYCVISVSDTGIGMSKELQEHVFDSFITGLQEPNYSTKIGLGLYIVKHTVEMHHGVILLESEPDKGSTFRMYIPTGKDHFMEDSYDVVTCETGAPPEDEKEDVQPLLAETASKQDHDASEKPCILVIEDNLEVRDYICSLFTQKYHVLEAGNGEEGVKMATEHLPLLIITDVMMPVMNGFESSRIIHQQTRTAHIPILMLTAKAEDVDVLKGLESGVDDYMMKPFNPEVLKVKVDRLIKQREHLRQIYTKALMLKYEQPSQQQPDEFMQQVINAVEANLCDPNLNVQMIAEKLNMSQPTLFRKIKQYTDLSVIEIIRSFRVSKAAALISEKRYSIQEISEMVGFSDVRTLRKHFTQQFGVSPSKFLNGKD
jgi:signal transduction histidine kinase/DNA-binding response OmpR family regulator/ligand-binding sensor domain-containing protein